MRSLSEPEQNLNPQAIMTNAENSLLNANEPERKQDEMSSPLNISVYRILYILLLLVRHHHLSLPEINRHLGTNPWVGRAYNLDTLSKYVYTLRMAGCHIARASNRNGYQYELMENPFPLSFEPDEVEVAGKLLTLLSQQPDNELTRDYQAFLLMCSLITPDSADKLKIGSIPALEDGGRRQLLNRYQDYCREAFQLQIAYRGAIHREAVAIESSCALMSGPSKGAYHAIEFQSEEGPGNRMNPDLSLLCHVEPQDVIVQNRHLYLCALDCDSNEPLVLDIEAIDSVKQLSTKNRRMKKSAWTVTFALYGRLAKSYSPYPQEWIVSQNEYELRVRSHEQNTEALMNRLMKYGELCQVLSPKPLREAMQARINRLLTDLSNPVV